MVYPPLCIETLESRQLLSISLVHHVLAVQSPLRAPSTIEVGLNPGGASVYADISYNTRKGPYTQTRTFPLSDAIRLLSINGGNASDSITIDQTNGSFPIATRINTHNGNDTVTGGDEPDTIRCGNGIDDINSGNGNDVVYAGRGPDTLVGGNGDDTLHAGRGGDMLVTGSGNSVLIDPYGHNTLLGGSGNDTYVLKNIRLDPDNTYDPAKDTLRKYNPPAKQSSNFFDNPNLDGFLGSLLGSYL
jgi:Ca2+-binding RTX toxin-like protein